MDTFTWTSPLWFVGFFVVVVIIAWVFNRQAK